MFNLLINKPRHPLIATNYLPLETGNLNWPRLHRRRESSRRSKSDVRFRRTFPASGDYEANKEITTSKEWFWNFLLMLHHALRDSISADSCNFFYYTRAFNCSSLDARFKWHSSNAWLFVMKLNHTQLCITSWLTKGLACFCMHDNWDVNSHLS